MHSLNPKFLSSFPPHSRSLAVPDHDYSHCIDVYFNPVRSYVVPPSRAIRLRAIEYDPDISSSYRLHPGRDNHRVPLAPTPLTLSRVGSNAIFSHYHQTRPWHIPNSTSFSMRKDFKPSNPTASDSGHRVTSTTSASQISLSYEGRIVVLRPRVNRGT